MAGEDEGEETPRIILTPEQEEMIRLQTEVNQGVETSRLMDVNGAVYISIVCSDAASVYWRPTFCSKCCKPKIVHPPLTLNNCGRAQATQQQRTLYELACKGNRTMDMVAGSLAAQKREERATALAAQNANAAGGPNNPKYDNRTELSEWSKEESWEAYKLVLEMYDKASEKKPVGKFNDLISALKKSGRADLTDRLLQDLMGQASHVDIISLSINWLNTRCGKTPTEEFIQAWRSYRTGTRKRDETIADYVNRFETITKKLEGHGVKLDKREKAVAMVEMAQLSSAECVAVLSIAKFQERGDDDGLEDRMKEAMRSVVGNIMGKESAPENTNTVLTVDHEQHEEQEPEKVYWDGNRWNGRKANPPPNYKSFQAGQPPRPAGPQQQQYRQSGYQNQPGWRNSNQPYQQGGWRDNRGQRPQYQAQGGYRRPYQVWYEDAQGNFFEAGEDGAPEDSGETPEQVMYSGQEHQNHIILDTGSKYNVMGMDTKQILERKMREAGCEPPVREKSSKLFKFGGNSNICKAKELLKFTVNLNGKLVPMEVHLVPGPLPFIIGKKWLKENGAKLDLMNQRLKINGAWVKTVDMGSGHEGITWDKSTHSAENSVYMGMKVSRKEWADPEVVEAMAKEIRNLQEMGTFTVVKDNPRIKKIDSTWVVTRKEAPDGKGTGAVKARLCVRGDQERDDYTIKKDSPTVDRATVKTLFAIAATNNWKVKTVDVTAAFLQGKRLEREVYVRPPAEYRQEDEVWQLLKGLYGLKEASMLWFKEVTAFFKENGCQVLTGDLAAFVCHQDGQVTGLVVIHVDDITMTGKEAWLETITRELRIRFKISKELIGDFIYTGINVIQDKDGTITLDQNHYVDCLEDLPKGAEAGMTPVQKRTLIKRIAGKLQYLNLSRPDLVFNVSMLSRAVKDEELDNQLEKCRALTAKAKNIKYAIKYTNLGRLEDLELHVYSDAAYANQDLDRVRSTVGIIIFLVGPRGSAPILWRSRAIRRVCKSVKTAETLALEEAVDAAINLSRQIHQMITGNKEEKGIPVRAFTDSQSLVDSVESCKQVVEGAMRLVVEKIKEHVQDGHVKEITWVRGARNWADGLTKKTVDMTGLIAILESGRLN